LGLLSKYECWVTDLIMPLYHDNENLSIINKSKHSKKKRGNTKNKMEGPMPKKTKNKKKSEPQREH
jgi:hypothetical protein